MLPAESNEPVEFGPFRFYARHRQLFCGNKEVHLGGRATDVLLALVRKKGELVTKEQLFAAAWPDIVVHESNLKVTVASLRRALREHSPEHEYITTLRRLERCRRARDKFGNCGGLRKHRHM
jgi:DNA-binding winged helix-turn-helix (wHTH) protein